ncbi:hypothetical protein [Paenibacillus montanisoli]|uniref:ABC transmembrane type-1 domain-containing protein n=1 Tax=Paenibacillus montanisoli TaxID=2081970 RepID=A0A328U643_9BACL|nr:hypothetical protein [Paenibacillus montanisoli]RAP78039.1 hypothetical protein DL346_06225 [Paenibacillus montanisoli]
MTEQASLLQRIWKYRLHYIIVVPPLLLWCILKGIPLVTLLYGTFVDLNIFQGLLRSEWVGLANFRNVLRLPEFGSVIANTISLKLGYTAVCGVAALVVSLLLSGIGYRRLRGGLAVLFLMPYFIPSAVIAYIVMLTLSPSGSPFGISSLRLGDPGQFPVILILSEVLKTCGIPILIALAAIGSRQAAMDNGAIPNRASFVHRNVVPAVRAIAAFMLMLLGTPLSIDPELQRLLVNPLVYETGETLDSFAFRIVFQNAEFNFAGPIALITFAVQLACTLLAYLLVRGAFARDLFTPSRGSAANRTSGKAASAAFGIGSIALASGVLLLLYMLFIYPFTMPASTGAALDTLFSPYRYALFLFMNAAGAVIFMGITALLAFPLTVKDLPGRGLYKLLLLVLLTVGGVHFYEYLFYKNLHTVNTVIPIFLTSFFSILPVFILKSIFNANYAGSRDEAAATGRGETHIFFNVYLPSIWKPLLALGALHAVMLWNSFTQPLIYLANPESFPPLLTFMTAMHQMGDSGLTYSPAALLQFAAILTVPPLLILLLMRRWMTGEVLTSTVRNL